MILIFIPTVSCCILTSGSPIPPTVPPHRHSTASTLKAERENAKQKKKKKRYLLRYIMILCYFSYSLVLVIIRAGDHMVDSFNGIERQGWGKREKHYQLTELDYSDYTFGSQSFLWQILLENKFLACQFL